MNRQIATKIHQLKPAATPLASGLLQRKCVCGNRTMTGGECEGCSKKKRLGLQTKLQVNEPGDSYEQEADRIAEQVIAMPAHSAVSGALPRVQRFSGQPSGQVDAAPASVDKALASPGRPLEPMLRQDMEQRFGHYFSQVRVHSGTAAAQSAREVNAYAYTLENEIVFGAGEYAPDTSGERRLVAHELVHTLQQGAGRGPVLQRACGPAAIGSVAGCTGRGGDIVDFGGSSDRIFLFEPSCDEFRPGEEARLRSVAATLPPFGRVDVDGFASEEGDLFFNEELSCARARAAARVLAAAGAAVTMILYKHGATPGGREDRRSVVITVTTPPAPAPSPPAPAPQPATPSPPGPPAPSTEDCSPAQIVQLNTELAAARTWVNDATRKITDFAYVFASSRHSAAPANPATAAVVRQALNDNFHTTATGHVLEIRDGFQQLRSALNGSFTYECEEEGCTDLGYVRGMFAAIRRLGDIHVCPPWFHCPDYYSRVRSLIHERTHQYPGATDHAYRHDPAYATLSPEDAIDNADSYAIAARQIYHGGAHGHGTDRC